VPGDRGADPAGLPVDRRRKKKLRLAFHFTLSNPAGWECEQCREKGLEARRRCGWLAAGEAGKERIVWARKGVAAMRCPRSEITAASEAWLELWAAWRHTGGVGELSARDADAMAVLTLEMEKEKHELDKT
jgi:hypothetical protein